MLSLTRKWVNTLEVIIHKEIEALEKLLPKWESLKEQFREITIFQDTSWMKSWWHYKSKQTNITPYIVEIREMDKTIGVLPLGILLVRFLRFDFRVLSPIGYEISDYLIPILSKEYPPEELLNLAFVKIYEDKLSWDFLKWGDVPADSFFAKFLKSNQVGKSIEGKRADTCPFLKVRNKVEEVTCKFDKNLLKKIHSKERKLIKKGTLAFTRVMKEDEIESVMNKFFELHCERWGKTDTPSKFLHVEEREHAMLAAKNLYNSNLLYLGYLSHNNEIIAVEFGMADGNKIYLYIPAFSLKYRNYSVGNLLNYYIILDACKKGYDVVDFLRGDEKHKNEWGTLEKFNVKYEFFNPSVRSFLFRNLIHNNKSRVFHFVIKNLSVVSRKILH